MSFSPMKSVRALLFAIAFANVILPQNSAFMLTTTRIHPRPYLIRFYSPHESGPSQTNVLTSFIKTAGQQKNKNLSTTKQINPLSDHSSFKSVLTTSFLTFAIWTSTFALPLTLLSTYNYDDAQNTMYSRIDPTATISSVKNSNQPQCWTAVDVVETLFSPTNFMASAKELASGSGSRVNKDPESLLRYGLPIPNDKEIRQLQATIEDIRQDISSKRKLAAIDDVKKARQLLKSKSNVFAAMCRDKDQCTSFFRSMNDSLDALDSALKDASSFLQGSDQERTALDNAYARQDGLQKLLTTVEEQMVPANYITPVPSDYDDLPQLQGRAVVEFVLQKPDDSLYVVDGASYKQATLTMVIDGYTAPITSGNFLDLVQKGFYNKMKIQRADGFVVQTGDPDGNAVGYVSGGKPNKSIGAGKYGERLIPLEIFVRGEKGPFYESTIEDEGKGGQATVLPFSSYGAMGWARDEYDNNSGSSQFFWLLFDSDLTPAGKNLLDGRYPCFGYVVQGANFLQDIKEDDIIVSTKILQGAENLIQPK